MGGLPSLTKRTRKRMRTESGFRLRRHRFATQRRCWCGHWLSETVFPAPLALLQSRAAVKCLVLLIAWARYRTRRRRCSMLLNVMRLGVVGGLLCSCLFRKGRCCLQPCVDARSCLPSWLLQYTICILVARCTLSIRLPTIVATNAATREEILGAYAEEVGNYTSYRGGRGRGCRMW